MGVDRNIKFKGTKTTPVNFLIFRAAFAPMIAGLGSTASKQISSLPSQGCYKVFQNIAQPRRTRSNHGSNMLQACATLTQPGQPKTKPAWPRQAQRGRALVQAGWVRTRRFCIGKAFDNKHCGPRTDHCHAVRAV